MTPGHEPEKTNKNPYPVRCDPAKYVIVYMSPELLRTTVGDPEMLVK